MRSSGIWALTLVVVVAVGGGASGAWAQGGPTSTPTPSVNPEASRPSTRSKTQAENPHAANPEATKTSTLALPPVTVNANATKAYYVPDASAGTKTDTPIMDTPLSVTIVPQQVLKDQQTTYLPDALQTVSGVVETDEMFGNDNVSIRGFDQKDLLYEDGLRIDEFAASGFPVDLAYVDQLQVVKGPAAVLYGQAEPGGLVDVVTKKPLDAAQYSLAQQFGPWQFYRTTLDATGPVVANGSLLYRFNLDYEDAGSFRNFIYTHRIGCFPTLEWRPNANNQVTVELRYSSGAQVIDNGIPFLPNGRPAKVSLSENYAQPTANRVPIDEYTAKAVAIHRFNKHWRMRVAYKSQYDNNPLKNLQFYAGSADAKGNLPRVGFTGTYGNNWSHQVVTDFIGDFAIKGVKDTLLTGFDLYYQHGHYDNNFFVLPTINIYEPNYNLPYDLPHPSTDFYVSNGQTAWGWYLQNQIEFPEDVFLLGGFRWDDVSQFNTSYGPAGSSSGGPQVTPRVGLLWRPVRELSLYTSYSENYGASALGSLAAPGHSLPPESAQQYEVGLKVQTPEGRFSSTASIYQLTKQNIPTTDPADPAYTIVVGEARSRGFELQVTGEIFPGWQAIGGYSYIGCFVTQDGGSPNLTGTRCQSVPYNSGSLWTTYGLRRGWLRGLKLGAGVVSHGAEVAYATSSTPKPYLVTDRISGFAEANAMASYEWLLGRAKLTSQINVYNLFDQRYFAAVEPSQAQPGSPLSGLGQIRLEF